MPRRIPVAQRFGKHRCHGGCDTATAPDILHARKITQLLHVSVHEIPGGRGSLLRQFRLCLISSALFFWLYFYDPPTQLRSLLAATAYTFIEYIFTGYENSDNFTSFAQFWGNLLYTPILLDVYWSVVVGSSDGGMPSALQAMSYVMLFPFNVWLLEIVLDQWFLIVYGRNVAWCYCTYTDSLVGGSVRVGHALYWLLLGMGCLVVYPTAQYWTNDFVWPKIF